MSHWIQYWTPEQVAVQRQVAQGASENIGHTAGEQFGSVQPGDAVYVLSRDGTALLLIGRLDVDEVLDTRQARQRLGDGIYEASTHLLGGGPL